MGQAGSLVSAEMIQINVWFFLKKESTKSRKQTQKKRKQNESTADRQAVKAIQDGGHQEQNTQKFCPQGTTERNRVLHFGFQAILYIQNFPFPSVHCDWLLPSQHCWKKKNSGNLTKGERKVR